MMGELIQMNAHMERSADARGLMAGGLIIAVLFIILAVCAAMSRREDHKVRYVLAFLGMAVVGTVMLIAGANQPREKIVRACANGPVSLEQVAAVYDIVDVDGKMLTLRVR